MPQTRRIPTYRRHRASGQAVVTLNGVDYYLGAWNTPQSKAEYDRLTAEWLSGGRCLPNRDGNPDDRLVKEVIHSFWGHIIASRSDLEAEKVRWALKPAREMYGETPAAKFGPRAFRAIRLKMIEAGLC